MRAITLFLALMILVTTISGCGSRRRFTIDTGANGSLEGVRTVPRDGDNNVSVNAWIRVYWPSGYEPPAHFTFALRNDSDVRVATIKHNGDQPYEWWFEPTENMDYDARYRIEIISDDEKVKNYFFTEIDDPYATLNSTRSAIPSGAGPRASEPLEEHTIYPQKSND